MPSICIIVIFASLLGTVAANTRFCTQDEKELANQLHEQNTEPAKSCYRASNGDITTLATSRLCPLPKCVTWLAYMAENAPDCYFDSKNYAIIYTAKNGDCTGDASPSGSSASGKSLSSSSTGSERVASTSFIDSNSSSGDSSFSAMSEDRTLNVTDSASRSIDGSSVGDVASVGGNSSAESASNETTTTPTPTPSEDLTIEDTTAPSTDSSSNPTPVPTSSAISHLSLVSSFAALFLAAAAVI